jgi:nitroreductase
MQAFLKLIREGQSARVSLDPDRKISADDMAKVLEAARWAPSAHNLRVWRNLKEFVHYNRFGSRPNCPFFITIR